MPPPESPSSSSTSNPPEGLAKRAPSRDALTSVARIHRVDVLSNDARQQCPPDSWDQSHNALLRTWRRQACINLWLQLSSSYFYERFNNWTTYPSIICTTVSSVGVFVTDHPAMRYCIAGMSLLSACLIALNRHSRAPELAQDYGTKTREYASFIRSLNFILILPFDQRPCVKETLTKLRADFDRINDTQTEPPINIIRMYEKNHHSLETSLYEDLKQESRFRISTEISDSDGS